MVGFAAARSMARCSSRRIRLGLVDIPVLAGVVEDVFEVGLGCGREQVPAHRRPGSPARLRARKASKSNGVDEPLRSPSTRACRSARRWVS